MLDITLVDYGVGNMHSIQKALERAGARVRPTSDHGEILASSCLVLPGVGACGAVMKDLAPIRDRLRAHLSSGIPALGVCVGMQILFERSEEGDCGCIGLLAGEVRRLRHPRLPHIGWNTVSFGGDPLFAGIVGGSHFYYVHSFAGFPLGVEPLAVTEYGEPFAAAIRVGNVYGVQFHPEKSSSQGLTLIRNFVEWASQRRA
ncbi:MAG: imidazole glycerol phosphate synthase subunit HisH [Planctomycetota bacterium]